MSAPSALAAPSGLIASAQRALRVLEVVAAAGDGVAAKAVARRAGYPLGTTYHLLNTLVHEGYLVSLGHSRGFGLGYKIGGLFTRLRETVDVGDEVRAALGALNREVDAPAYFAVFRARRAVVAEVADSPTAPRAQPLEPGFHEAPHATAFGKVMLAALPRGERQAYLAETGLAGPGDAGERLERELARVARTGAAVDVAEFRSGLACVAVAVRGDERRNVGAVAVSVPVSSFPSRRAELELRCRAAAARISAILTSN